MIGRMCHNRKPGLINTITVAGIEGSVKLNQYLHVLNTNCRIFI